jgi:hypothetical protein
MLPTTPAAEQRQQHPLEGVTAGHQHDRRGHPHQADTDTGNHRQRHHERAPERRAGHARHGEGDAGQRALQQADDGRPLQRGPRDRAEPVQEQSLLRIIERQVEQDAVDQAAAPLQEEVHGVEHHPEHEQEVQRAAGGGREAVDEQATGEVDRLPRAHHDVVPVGFDAFVERERAQPHFHLVGVVQLVLHPRHGRFAHVDGLGRDQAQQARQWQQHHQHHDHEHDDSRRTPPPAQQFCRAPVQRLRQRREDAGDDQRHHERADHLEEENRDADDQRDQEQASHQRGADAASRLGVGDHGRFYLRGLVSGTVVHCAGSVQPAASSRIFCRSSRLTPNINSPLG